MPKPTLTPDQCRARSQGALPDLFGIDFLTLEWGRVHTRLDIKPEFLAPNGYLHAATVVALADTTCGFGSLSHLPVGAGNFTTLELKSNFLSTAKEGAIDCEAVAVHLGRTTHVWDATVRREDTAKIIALFRCTQMILI